MSFFATIFGYVLKFLYDIVNNYGVAIILFSILVKLIMLPLTIKQQKTLKKNQKMQEEMQRIQFNYKNDPEKMNQEMMSLYKREGMSPFSGCFSSIIQIVLLLSVFYLVSSPLTYMVRLDSDVINNMKNIVNAESETGNTRYEEIAIIQYVRNLEEPESAEDNATEEGSAEENNVDGKQIEASKEDETKKEEQTEEETQQENQEETKFNIYDYVDQVNLNMDFLGIDLSQVPTQNAQDWKTWIIPVLYVVSSFVSIKLTNSTGKKKEKGEKLITDGKEPSKEEYNPMANSNKIMSWSMPVLSASIAVIAPLGLALYWLMNNILMIVERLVLNKIFDKEEEAEKNA